MHGGYVGQDTCSSSTERVIERAHAAAVAQHESTEMRNWIRYKTKRVEMPAQEEDETR
jgi:hypothetical protein